MSTNPSPINILTTPALSGKFEKDFTSKLAQVVKSTQSSDLFLNAAEPVISNLERFLAATPDEKKARLIFRIENLPGLEGKRPNNWDVMKFIDGDIPVIVFLAQVKEMYNTVLMLRDNAPCWAKIVKALPSAVTKEISIDWSTFD